MWAIWQCVAAGYSGVLNDVMGLVASKSAVHSGTSLPIESLLRLRFFLRFLFDSLFSRHHHPAPLSSFAVNDLLTYMYIDCSLGLTLELYLGRYV